MKKINLAIASILLINSVNAQDIDRQVVANSGGFTTTSTVQLSYTLGETVIEYSSTPEAILSQGFQQENAETVSLHDLEGTEFQLIAYPNPFINSIEIKSEQLIDDVNFELTDVNGKIVPIHLQEIASGSHWKIVLLNPSMGNYFLTISAFGQQEIIQLLALNN